MPTLSSYADRTKEILGVTNFIPNKYFINYNSWHESKQYRQKIALDLGLHFTDFGFLIVPWMGGPGGSSSFTRKEFDGRANEMEVLTRWKTYANNDNFKRLFKQNMHLVEMSNEIFGEIPGTQELLK